MSVLLPFMFQYFSFFPPRYCAVQWRTALLLKETVLNWHEDILELKDVLLVFLFNSSNIQWTPRNTFPKNYCDNFRKTDFQATSRLTFVTEQKYQNFTWFPRVEICGNFAFPNRESRINFGILRSVWSAFFSINIL